MGDYDAFAVCIMVALVILGAFAYLMFISQPIKGSCSMDLKWEDYSCVVGDDVYVSCPHPTHIECKGDIPLAILKGYVK